ILLSKMLGSVIIAHKLYFITLLALGAFGQRLVFEKLCGRGGFVSGLVYLLNPWVVYRISKGHNLIIMGSALLPFAFISFLSLEREYSISRVLLAGFLSSLLLLISPHMGYIFFIILFLYGISKPLKGALTLRELLKQAILFAQTGFLAIAFGMPVLILVIMGIGSKVTVVRLEETAFYSLRIHLLVEKWPYLIVGLGVVLGLFLFIGKGKESLFSLLLILVGLTLSFGGVWPISLVISALYKYLPGFFIFRELNKFLYIALFGGSLLFEALVLELRGFTESLMGKKWSLGPISRKLIGFLFIVLALLALIIPDRNIISGDLGGNVGTIQLPPHLMELDDWLRSQEGDFRVAFFPPACWAADYDWSERWFLDPVVSLQAKPTVEIRSEMDITPSNNFVKWVYMAIYRNRTNRFGKLLGLLGVKYVIYRPDVDMPDERADLRHLGKEETIPLFERENDLVLIRRIGEYEIYLNKHALPLVAEGFRPVLIVGDRRALISLSHLDLNFTENVCIFLDNLYDYAGLEELIQGCKYAIIDPKNWMDLRLALSKEKVVLKPWDFVEMSTDASSRWIRGDFSWYSYGGTLNVAPDNYVMTNRTGNSLLIPFTITKEGNFSLFVQCFTTSNDNFGQISVKLDDFPQKLVQSRVPGSIEGYYRWVDLGEFHLAEGRHFLRFRSVGGAAAISKIVLLPKDASPVDGLDFLPRIVLLMDDDFWDFKGPPGSFAISPDFSNGRAVCLLNGVYGLFYVPRGGDYSLILKTHGEEGIPLQVSLDGTKFDMKIRKGSLILKLSINKGFHTITMTSNASCVLDLALLVEGDEEFPLKEERSILIPSYSRSPCSCTLMINSPYLLFLETYEPGWRLSCGENMEPLPAFSYANLYLIEGFPKGNCTLSFVGCELVLEGFLIAPPLVAVIALSVRIFKKKGIIREET
ncbi:MAG: hypothetical protein DRO05_05215, partial [Thermoproteota archaeon]